MMASLQPVATPAPTTRPTVRRDNVTSAAGLLDQGIRLTTDGHFAAAAEAFDEAIATGRLNNAGRAFAYWQIYIASEELGDVDGGSNALASFVVVAAEVLTARRRTRYAVNEAGDFVDRFGLDPKLRRARAALSAAWADRTEYFGRSADLPVPVHDLIEMEQFLDLAAGCDDSDREQRAQREIARPSGERIRQVTITCGDYGRLAEFFFSVVSD